jgi:hypothetical protein
VFSDPNNGIYRGRDEIDRISGAIKATHPDFQYQPIAEPDVSGDGGRIQWVSGRPGETPAYAGTDFIVARGRPHSRRLSLLRQAAWIDRVAAYRQIRTDGHATGDPVEAQGRMTICHASRNVSECTRQERLAPTCLRGQLAFRLPTAEGLPNA